MGITQENDISCHQLTAGGTTIVLACRETAMPECLYLGPSTDKPEQLQVPDLPVRPASPDKPVPLSLFPQHGSGFPGEPALLGNFGEGPWETQFEINETNPDGNTLQFICRDIVSDLQLTLQYTLDEVSGILISRTTLINKTDRPYHLARLAALCLPLPAWVSEARLFRGDWADEGHLQRIPLFCGKIERNSRQGRPGFDWPQFALLTEQETTDQKGLALGLHLGWSGNHQLIIEQDAHQEAQIQLAEWLAPGELLLAPGDCYQTPATYAAVSSSGLNGLRHQFHNYVRQQKKERPKSRPVHLNTWEGVYFEVDESSVIELAESAAVIGVERFILDDGWFKGRKDDTSSLGDWQPDPERFPNGLSPVIEAVHRAGMSFGLWIEPEMINPDSDLYRQYPDWVLQAPGLSQTTGRNQLLLDLINPAVQRFIVSTVSGLLDNNSIDYLKWDYNRALYPGSNAKGPVYHQQTRALYNILDELSKKYPETTIESCSSGGGRIDFGILKYTDRIWPSDNTDAIERLRIQWSLGLFLPPEIIGAHAGPAPYILTGRNLPMAFRCLVAMFGHFGAELDPRKLSESDAATFREAARIYKDYRHMIHTGQLLCLDTQEAGTDVQLVLSRNHKDILLRIVNSTDTPLNMEIDLSQYTSWKSCSYTDLLSTRGAVLLSTVDMKFSITLSEGPSGMLYYLKEEANHD